MKIAYVFFNGIVNKENLEFYKKFIEKNKGDIFCADGGTNICYELNLLPNEIWGDLDSISEEVLNFYEKKQVMIKRFSFDKDKTDSELVLESLEGRDYDKIYCLASLGGAIEHELTNINLLFKYKNLIFLNGDSNYLEKIFRIKNKYLFENSKGSKISFIIYSDKIENISLEGFKYNLKKENFKRGDTRFISNIITRNKAFVEFSCGDILCVQKNTLTSRHN